MAMQTEDVIVRNLVEALERLQKDLDCVELWAATLSCFQSPVPTYQPSNNNLLASARNPKLGHGG